MITETVGKRFTQLSFDSSFEGTWTMAKEALIRNVRLTAKTGQLKDSDFITFAEAEGHEPKIFTLSSEARATIIHSNRPTKFKVSEFYFTNPTEVIVSIELD